MGPLREETLTVICWKWMPQPGYRSHFGAAAVNTLCRMVRRHYPEPHRFVCVTDDPNGIDADVEVQPAWNDFADVPSPHGGRNPSCYRRLRLFHPEASTWFGERFVNLDLDCVITGDLRPLWNRSEDFIAWGDTNPLPGSHYNGSMMLIRAGSRPQLWTDFDPKVSPRLSKQANCFGSDQGWISYRLGKGEAKWTRKDGVYSFRNEVAKRGGGLPSDARVVFFHGANDPWDRSIQQRYPWVKVHYN
jgi:hypothetical protein